MRNIMRPSGVTPYLVAKLQIAHSAVVSTKCCQVSTIQPDSQLTIWQKYCNSGKKSSVKMRWPLSHVSIPSVCIPGSRKCKVETCWKKLQVQSKNGCADYGADVTVCCPPRMSLDWSGRTLHDSYARHVVSICFAGVFWIKEFRIQGYWPGTGSFVGLAQLLE